MWWRCCGPHGYAGAVERTRLLGWHGMQVRCSAGAVAGSAARRGWLGAMLDSGGTRRSSSGARGGRERCVLEGGVVGGFQRLSGEARPCRPAMLWTGGMCVDPHSVAARVAPARLAAAGGGNACECRRRHRPPSSASGDVACSAAAAQPIGLLRHAMLVAAAVAIACGVAQAVVGGHRRWRLRRGDTTTTARGCVGAVVQIVALRNVSVVLTGKSGLWMFVSRRAVLGGWRGQVTRHGRSGVVVSVAAQVAVRARGHAEVNQTIQISPTTEPAHAHDLATVGGGCSCLSASRGSRAPHPNVPMADGSRRGGAERAARTPPCRSRITA